MCMCVYVTDVRCNTCHRFTNPIVSLTSEDRFLISEHIYSCKRPLFYFCSQHAHYHQALPTIVCKIHAERCCSQAINLVKLTTSFVMAHLVAKGPNDLTALVYIIYDPSTWREQPLNHFISLVKAFILKHIAIPDRYRSFEKSKFTIANILLYKSGGDSVIRSSITGFETRGIYQTSTISCLLDQQVIILPQKLYDLLKKEGYDMTYAIVVRHPSFKSTSCYILLVIRNPDVSYTSIIISDRIAEGLHQDQDGDKNVVVLMHTRNGLYRFDTTSNFFISKMEMARAFARTKTILGFSRFKFSESTIVTWARNREELYRDTEFGRAIAECGTAKRNFEKIA